MIYFSNNLKFLREKANKTLNEMAFDLGFSTASRFNNYENGTSKPDFDTLVLDTIQGALVKRVNQGSSSEKIKLVSDNTSYGEFEIPISEIHALALVVGVIRFE